MSRIGGLASKAPRCLREAMTNTLHAATATDVADQKAMDMFAQQWQLYRKILDHDYLGNDGAYATLRQVLDTQIARPFRLLDLACGDAAGIANTLAGTQVTSYRGVDLSAPALKSAEANLRALTCDVALEQADFTEVVRSGADRLDVVWISLSLHHLETPAKRALMREVREGMDADGAFLIYEPTRDDGEGRPAYMDRLEANARRNWTALSADEFNEAITHVRTFDLPETISDWEAMGREAGFAHVDELYRSPDDLFRVINYRP